MPANAKRLIGFEATLSEANQISIMIKESNSADPRTKYSAVLNFVSAYLNKLTQEASAADPEINIHAVKATFIRDLLNDQHVIIFK